MDTQHPMINVKKSSYEIRKRLEGLPKKDLNAVYQDVMERIQNTENIIKDLKADSVMKQRANYRQLDNKLNVLYEEILDDQRQLEELTRRIEREVDDTEKVNLTEESVIKGQQLMEKEEKLKEMEQKVNDLQYIYISTFDPVYHTRLEELKEKHRVVADRMIRLEERLKQQMYIFMISMLLTSEDYDDEIEEFVTRFDFIPVSEMYSQGPKALIQLHERLRRTQFKDRLISSVDSRLIDRYVELLQDFNEEYEKVNDKKERFASELKQLNDKILEVSGYIEDNRIHIDDEVKITNLLERYRTEKRELEENKQVILDLMVEDRSSQDFLQDLPRLVELIKNALKTSTYLVLGSENFDNPEFVSKDNIGRYAHVPLSEKYRIVFYDKKRKGEFADIMTALSNHIKVTPVYKSHPNINKLPTDDKYIYLEPGEYMNGNVVWVKGKKPAVLAGKKGKATNVVYKTRNYLRIPNKSTDKTYVEFLLQPTGKSKVSLVAKPQITVIEDSKIPSKSALRGFTRILDSRVKKLTNEELVATQELVTPARRQIKKDTQFDPYEVDRLRRLRKQQLIMLYTNEVGPIDDDKIGKETIILGIMSNRARKQKERESEKQPEQEEHKELVEVVSNKSNKRSVMIPYFDYIIANMLVTAQYEPPHTEELEAAKKYVDIIRRNNQPSGMYIKHYLYPRYHEAQIMPSETGAYVYLKDDKQYVTVEEYMRTHGIIETSNGMYVYYAMTREGEHHHRLSDKILYAINQIPMLTNPIIGMVPYRDTNTSTVVLVSSKNLAQLTKILANNQYHMKIYHELQGMKPTLAEFERRMDSIQSREKSVLKQLAEKRKERTDLLRQLDTDAVSGLIEASKVDDSIEKSLNKLELDDKILTQQLQLLRPRIQRIDNDIAEIASRVGQRDSIREYMEKRRQYIKSTLKVDPRDNNTKAYLDRLLRHSDRSVNIDVSIKEMEDYLKNTQEGDSKFQEQLQKLLENIPGDRRDDSRLILDFTGTLTSSSRYQNLSAMYKSTMFVHIRDSQFYLAINDPQFEKIRGLDNRYKSVTKSEYQQYMYLYDRLRAQEEPMLSRDTPYYDPFSHGMYKPVFKMYVKIEYTEEAPATKPKARVASPKMASPRRDRSQNVLGLVFKS